MRSLKYLPLLLAGPLLAQEAGGEAAPHTSYILNTLLFLIGGFLVMWMAAGFAMLEAGLVRSKNVSTQLMKNIMIFAIGGFMYYLIGYKVMYPGDAWTITGILGDFGITSLEPVGVGADGVDVSYASVGSDFFFQLMFCATTASIVSGTLAERIKLTPFLIFTVVLTGLIYPIEASWQWGGGFLSGLGFSDFAGSTLVHAAGGWAALAGALILGPRLGRFGSDGRVTPFPGSNMPLATLGTFILWLGWFGFNGASQLAMGTIGDVTDVSRIFVNTNAAAGGGAIIAYFASAWLFKKPDLTMVLNGALAGLVSITAEPLMPSVTLATAIGGFGGLLAVLSVPMLDKLKIDDVVGAIPVHLICGIYGTLVVVLSNPDTNIVAQFIGVVSVGAFVFVVSAIIWMILRSTIGIRVSEEEEINGLDSSELGVAAYPEFSIR